jgi:hypothetical protein
LEPCQYSNTSEVHSSSARPIAPAVPSRSEKAISHGHFDVLAGTRLHGTDRTERHRDAEQLVQQRSRLAATDVIGASEHRDHRGQAGSEC